MRQPESRRLCHAVKPMARAEEPGVNPGLSRNCDRGAACAATAAKTTTPAAEPDRGGRQWRASIREPGDSGHRLDQLRARKPGKDEAG